MINCLKYVNSLLTLWLIEEDGFITDITFSDPNLEIQSSKSLEIAIKEIEEYFLGKRQKFTFPIKIEGTTFQNLVYLEMRNIDYGNTLTYKELTSKVTDKKAYRAVGSTCKKNRLPIVIPCHRILSSKGIGGYSGGIHIKKMLLDLEKNNINH